MITDLHEIFPEGISDEAAYYISQFFMELGLKIESHYYGQIVRYVKDNRPDDINDDIIF